ncbi:MAG: single-stranded DNA-binding protein [Planctomycetes bacterium]|nr:single-stranded DNA-binding protein [Planctomycetota bacterium]
MITLNKVFLVGNLARDPQLRYTPSGTPVAEFRLAVSDTYVTSSGDKKDRTCFIDVVSWRKLAESCGSYLTKGSPVFVEGRLEQDTWETNDGQKRSRIRVVAYSVQFIRRESERTQSGRQGAVGDGGFGVVTDVSKSGRLAPTPSDEDFDDDGGDDLDDFVRPNASDLDIDNL